jgi:hypothetical protein
MEHEYVLMRVLESSREKRLPIRQLISRNRTCKATHRRRCLSSTIATALGIDPGQNQLAEGWIAIVFNLPVPAAGEKTRKRALQLGVICVGFAS